MARDRGLHVPSVKTLLGRLGNCGEDIPLSVLATATITLGMGMPFANAWLRALAEGDDPFWLLSAVWKEGAAGAPWLDGYLGPLTGFLDDYTPDREAKVRQAARAFVDVDLKALTESPPYDGDFLGPFYTMLRSQHAKKGTGAFYTPMSVTEMMGAMVGPPEAGQSVLDPCCGSGAMLIGTAKAMRKAGRNPGLVLWAANDIDPMAVALAGVSLTVHGCGPHIWLSVGDGLLLGSGLADDPHVTQPPWWVRDPARAGLTETKEDDDGSGRAA